MGLFESWSFALNDRVVDENYKALNFSAMEMTFSLIIWTQNFLRKITGL